MINNIHEEEKEFLLENNHTTIKMAEEDMVTTSTCNDIESDRECDVTILTSVSVKINKTFDAIIQNDGISKQPVSPASIIENNNNNRNSKVIRKASQPDAIQRDIILKESAVTILNHEINSVSRTPKKSPTSSLKHIIEKNNNDNNNNNIECDDEVSKTLSDIATANNTNKNNSNIANDDDVIINLKTSDVINSTCVVMPIRDIYGAPGALRKQHFPAAAAEIMTNRSEHLTTSTHEHINSISSTNTSVNPHCAVEIRGDDECSNNRDINDSRRQANSISSDIYDTVSLSEPCCRVCQCNSKEEILISPCLCSGSVKWIHESCLIKWMKCSLKDSCELCTEKIKITKQKKPFSKVSKDGSKGFITIAIE